MIFYPVAGLAEDFYQTFYIYFIFSFHAIQLFAHLLSVTILYT